MRLWRVRSSIAAAAMLAGAVATPAAAEVSANDVKAAIETEFAAEVLEIVETEGPAGPAYLVTVMNSGGNFNSAFRVTQLMVDRRTGRLLSSFRHLAAGYELSGTATFGTGEGHGEAVRRRSLEGRR